MTAHAHFVAESDHIPLSFVDGPKVGLQGLAPRIELTKQDGDVRTGDDRLDAVITDGSAALSEIECDFENTDNWVAETSWAGPLVAGASFRCRAELEALPGGEPHGDRATVVATVQVPPGADPLEPVTDSDVFFALDPNIPDIEVEKFVFDVASPDPDGPCER